MKMKMLRPLGYSKDNVNREFMARVPILRNQRELR
jgi:hypothetical protein